MSDVSVTFGAKDEGLQSAFKRVGDSTKSLGSLFKQVLLPLAAIGAAFAGVRKMAADFQAAIDMGGRLNDLSARTGETAGNLLLLERAFQNAGAGANSVGPALNKMQRFMVEASERGGEQAATMNKLGLSYERLQHMTPTEQMQAFAKAISEMDDPAERTTAAMQVLGRSGGELVPLFRAMGVELETAKRQLGSAPAIIDKTNQALDTIGDNMGAIREKSKEFALGILSQLAPALAEITSRMAEINAAGIGEVFSMAAKNALDWANSTFKVGQGLADIKLGFDAILGGQIGDGLKLIWLSMRDTALNAINQISATGMSALQTVGGFLSKIFAADSAFVRLAESAFNYLGKLLSIQITEGVLAGIPKIRFFQDTITQMEAEISAARLEAVAAEIKMGNRAKETVQEIGRAAADLSADFKSNYEQNVKNPLVEMRDKMQETADLSAKVQQNLENAADAMTDINASAPGLDSPSPNVPSAADIAEDIARANMIGSARSGGGSAKDRSLTAEEQKMLERFNAGQEISLARDAFNAADRAKAMADAALQRDREREAMRDMQRERGLGGGTIMTPEQIAERELGGLDPKAVEKRARQISDEMKERAKQGDGTDAPSKKGGGASGAQESPLERIVSEIKSILQVIEPKLPTPALAP
jgi:hypothetical protein